MRTVGAMRDALPWQLPWLRASLTLRALILEGPWNEAVWPALAAGALDERQRILQLTARYGETPALDRSPLDASRPDES